MESKGVKNEIMSIGRKHSVNLDRELMLIFEFLDINPYKNKMAINILLDIIATAHKARNRSASVNYTPVTNFKDKYNSSCKRGVKTSQLAKKFFITQADVVYHLNNFMKKGVIVKKGRLYCLRESTLEETIYEVELDKLREFTKIKKVAKRIDDFL